MKSKPNYRSVVLGLLFIFVFQGCVKDDVTNITDNIVFTPTYSVPLGTTTFVLDSLMGQPGFDTIVVDTPVSADSSFTYNNETYFLPNHEYFDTTFTSELDFSVLQDWIHNATYIMFRLNMENSIPADIFTQVTLLDGAQNEVFSLFESPGLFIPAADSLNHTIISPYDTEPLTQTEIFALPDVRYIQTYIRMYIQNTSSGARYYPEQFFNLQMGVRLGLEIASFE